MNGVLHEFHDALGARFTHVNGVEMAADYGDSPAEYAALRQTAGVMDLSARSRLCLVGADRARFLHGQVTNDIKRLTPGTGAYAAVTTAKGKMETDLNVFCLADELLLDFEPGLSAKIAARLEKFIVADDVQVIDAAPHYGLLTVQGPKAAEAICGAGFCGNTELPSQPFGSVKLADAALGEIYLANLPRLGGAGFDLYIPQAQFAAAADKLIQSAKRVGGRPCGWAAFEVARIEAGIPRFGADMDETTIPLECGLESRAISYSKGCYIGQEVINRIHSIGHVNRELRGLRLADHLPAPPAPGDKLTHEGKDIGHVTSAAYSPSLRAHIALGYVRRDVAQIGTELLLRGPAGDTPAKIVALPFMNIQ